MIPVKNPIHFYAIIPVKYDNKWHWTAIAGHTSHFCPQKMGIIAKILWWILRKMEGVD